MKEKDALRAGDAAEGEGILPGGVVLAILTGCHRGQGTGDEGMEHVGMSYRRRPRPLLFTHTHTRRCSAT